MKSKLFLFVILIGVCAFSYQSNEKKMDNPFLKEWKTPFQTPPFNEIKTEHFLPAFEEGIKEQNSRIDEIVTSKEKPTFKNTLEALELSSELIRKVNRVFLGLNSAVSNEAMQKIAATSASMLSKQNGDIHLNRKLFERVKFIYDKQNKLNLTTEQKRLLKNYYLEFVLGGANLSEDDKEKLRIINDELSQLALKFETNVRKENSNFSLIIENKSELAGLSDASIQSAAAKAKAKGLDGKWRFTIDRSTLMPVLQYSQNRDMREKLYKAYMNRGNNNDEFDNKKIFSRIISLRVQVANLLGYKTYADLILQRNMAMNPDNVFKLLNEIWIPASKKAKSEADEILKMIETEGNKFSVEPWDWWYYAEKVKKEKYALNEEMLRPYFKLENVIKGAFDVATKLYGIKFIERKDIPVYHPDVNVFEVQEASGKHLGVLYTDYFPRENKTGGGWTNPLRIQSNMNNRFITPLICTNCNFSKPTSDKPALISSEEVKTLFHEFGHALHGLLQNVSYPNVSGVPPDFAEFPSQTMENWAMRPEVLKMYAKHYQSNEPIKQELIDKIINARYFNQGFETLESMGAAFLDMDWHIISDVTELDVAKFEKDAIHKMKMIPQILPKYLSTNFLHIASWGYQAGYYSYLWSAILSSDAFEAFSENGLFDKSTAVSFRKNILSKGDSEELITQYKKFRGREPKIDALMKKRGLN